MAANTIFSLLRFLFFSLQPPSPLYKLPPIGTGRRVETRSIEEGGRGRQTPLFFAFENARGSFRVVKGFLFPICSSFLPPPPTIQTKQGRSGLPNMDKSWQRQSQEAERERERRGPEQQVKSSLPSPSPPRPPPSPPTDFGFQKSKVHFLLSLSDSPDSLSLAVLPDFLSKKKPEVDKFA